MLLKVIQVEFLNWYKNSSLKVIFFSGVSVDLNNNSSVKSSSKKTKKYSSDFNTINFRELEKE